MLTYFILLFYISFGYVFLTEGIILGFFLYVLSAFLSRALAPWLGVGQMLNCSLKNPDYLSCVVWTEGQTQKQISEVIEVVRGRRDGNYLVPPFILKIRKWRSRDY